MTGHILLCFWKAGQASVGLGPRQKLKIALNKALNMSHACSTYLTYMHGQYTAGDEFTVLSDAEVPRFYPHHVIKHELQVQAALYADLGSDN